MTSTQYSISAASRIIGKSRTTVSRHMASGKLAYELDRENNKVVEASELMRVYGNDCDFEQETKRSEKRGQASGTSRSESKTAEPTAALDAMRDKLIQHLLPASSRWWPQRYNLFF